MFFPSVSALITFPRVSRDLLIAAPSFKDVPLVPDFSTRSEPARSTRFNVDILVGLSLAQLLRSGLADGVATFLPSIVNRTITCDLELCAFIFVTPKCLLPSPSAKSSLISSAVSQLASLIFLMIGPNCGWSIISNLSCFSDNKSDNSSLYNSAYCNLMTYSIVWWDNTFLYT